MQELSTVLYLTDCGGPTVVLEQRPGDDLAPRGWRIMPSSNCLLAFQGNHLHGVMPEGAALSWHGLMPATTSEGIAALLACMYAPVATSFVGHQCQHCLQTHVYISQLRQLQSWKHSMMYWP